MARNSQRLEAQIVRYPRGSLRHIVRFNASVVGSDETRAIVHDLSETGMKLECLNPIPLGETFIVDLPFLGQIEACVVRHEANICGVEFLTPLSKATVSAAILHSHPAPPAAKGEGEIVEIPVGNDPSLQQITEFAQELDLNKGVTGNRLVGFSQSADGTINALVMKSD